MRQVSLKEFLSHIEGAPGSRMGAGKSRPEPRKDPVVKLTRPLAHCEGRVFFYCGLLYGFCRLDASITERYREQTGSTLETLSHTTEHPVVVLPWFPDFVKTNVAHLLQSCPAGPEQANLFDFISSQLIIDRNRQAVWKVKMIPLKIPDPVMLANKELPVAADILVFVPYRHDSGFQVIPKVGMVVGTPEVLRVEHHDPEFHKKTEEILRGK